MRATTLLTFLFFSLSSQAQLAQELHIGIKTGINYNKLKGSGFSSTTQSDWHLGGYAQLRGQKLGIGLEAILDRGTYELKNIVTEALKQQSDDSSMQSAMLRTHKLQVPIYLMYKYSIVHLMLGAVYELHLSLKDRQQMIADAQSNFRNSYPSLMTGVWLDITKRINIGARYQFSLQNINTENIRSRWNSREAQLHFGIKI